MWAFYEFYGTKNHAYKCFEHFPVCVCAAGLTTDVNINGLEYLKTYKAAN